MRRSTIWVMLAILIGAGCAAPTADRRGKRARTLRIADDVAERLARFAPVEIRADLSGLTEADRRTLGELMAASELMGRIFLRQAWSGNPDLRNQLALCRKPRAETALALFDVMAGPWDRLDEAPFVGTTPRPEGAGFYPDDMTRGEFEAWIAAHPEDADAFEGLYTVIERRGDELVAVPYHEVYRRWLEPAAEHLKAAAGSTQNASLKKFLLSRAEAFLDDDYYQSDKDWMDLDSSIEITIGPYEVYEDRMFGYKASYESFLTIVSPEESRKLDRYKNELPAMERNLPIPDDLKNKNRGTESPIRVADIVYTAGDTRAGVQTIAFNLPNDERVREEKGSKKVILRNVMAAKYSAIMEPIARAVIHPDQHGDLDSDAFIDETLFHELSHGLGPGRIVVDGRETEVRKELEEVYSSSEECKADVMGAYNVLFMIDRGLLPKTYRRRFLTTYFAGLFRSVRFGTTEAHGLGAAVQISYFIENGGAVVDPDTGTFRVVHDQLARSIGELTGKLCVLQAHGDKVGMTAFLERYGVLPPEAETALSRLKEIPVDIRPVFTAAGERM